MKEVMDQFYNSSGLYLPVYESQSSSSGALVVEKSLLHLEHADGIDKSAIPEKLREISCSLRLIEYNGSYFEIAEVNTNANSEDIMLHISTFSSSITGNAGNAYELAAQALRYPNHRQLYIASFGNGGTGALTASERKYARRYGLFTMELGQDAVPLPTIRNLHRALLKNNLVVTRLMGTDSAGGPYASALGVAMEKDQLTHAFFSERSGFVNLSKLAIAKGILYDEGIVNAKQNKQESIDPNALTDDMIEQAKQALRSGKELEQRQDLEAHMVGKVDLVKSLYTSMQALRRGPSHKRNPLVEDTVALKKHQPNAKLTFGMAERDPLYENPETAHKAAQQFVSEMATRGFQVRVVMVPDMSHAYNTYLPGLYHALKREALEI